MSAAAEVADRLTDAAREYELLAGSNRDRYLVELLREAAATIERLRAIAEPATFAEKEAEGHA